MKKILTILVCLLSVLCLNVNAAKTTKSTMPAVVEGKEKVKVYIFTREACGYCIAAENYLDSIKDTYGDYFEMVVYEVYNSSWKVTNKTYEKTMQKVAETFNTAVSGTPYIVVGDSYDINGWNAETTGDEIKATILKEYVNENYKDVVAEKLAEVEAEPDPHANDTIIVICFAVLVIGGIGCLIYFGRKNK